MIRELQACMDMPAMLPPLEDENTFSNHSGLTCFFGRGSLLMGGQKTVHSFDYGGHLFRVTFFFGHRLQLSPALRFTGLALFHDTPQADLNSTNWKNI